MTLIFKCTTQRNNDHLIDHFLSKNDFKEDQLESKILQWNQPHREHIARTVKLSMDGRHIEKAQQELKHSAPRNQYSPFNNEITWGIFISQIQEDQRNSEMELFFVFLKRIKLAFKMQLVLPFSYDRTGVQLNKF